MAHGTHGAGMDGTTLPVTCSALQPLPGAGGTLAGVRGKRAREAGTLPCRPRTWCFLKNWHTPARACERVTRWAEAAIADGRCASRTASSTAR